MGSEFGSSETFKTVKNGMTSFLLNGMDPVVYQETIAKKWICAKTDTQIVNILASVLRFNVNPMEERNESLDELYKRVLADGNKCLFSDKRIDNLKKVAQKMNNRSFMLIPLVLVDCKDKAIKAETVLVKVKNEVCSAEYVDMSGRTYEDFESFLNDNKLPNSILCYPTNGDLSLDDYAQVKLGYRVVGVKNTIYALADLAAGIVGFGCAVGMIFATGGLAVPIMLGGGAASTVYGSARGIANLRDLNKHKVSLNPLKSSEARMQWIGVAMNMTALASTAGRAALLVAQKSETIAAATVDQLCKVNKIIQSASTCVSVINVGDAFWYTVQNWGNLTLSDKIYLACSICFAFREVINFVNGLRLINESHFEGICNALSSSVEAGMMVGSAFMTNAKRIFADNSQYLENGMMLLKFFIKDRCNLEVSEDCITVKIFGLSFNLPYIIRMGEENFKSLMYTLSGIAVAFKDTFSLLRSLFGDDNIMKVVSTHVKSLEGDKHNEGYRFAKSVNQLLEVTQLIIRMGSDLLRLKETELIIGRGHCFTIGSAFNAFIKEAPFKGPSLVKALVEMTEPEVKKLNALRARYGSMESNLFRWILANSNGSERLLEKIRILLRIDELCVDKSLKITDLISDKEEVEIESLIKITPHEFSKAKHQDWLVDVTFLRMCSPAFETHREQLQKLWKHTCIASEVQKEDFDKLELLKYALGKPESLKVIVSHAFSSSKCCDLFTFIDQCLDYIHEQNQAWDKLRSSNNKNMLMNCD